MKSILPAIGLLGISLMFLVAANSAAAQSFEFNVERERTLRDQTGKLVITPDRIEYQTPRKGESRVWRYNELREIKVLAPARIELHSYEDRKRMLGADIVYKFKLLDGEITPELSALLLAKSPRPPALSVSPEKNGDAVFVVPVKHLHRFGGCLGALKIYADRIVYEADGERADSRYWRYRDVQSFSQSERFRFELLGFEEDFGGAKVYNFQLREELPAGAYDFIWQRVYPLKFHSTGSVQAKP